LLQFPLQAGTYRWGWSAGIGHFSAIQYLEAIPSFKTYTAVWRSPTGTVTSIKAWRAGTVVFIYQEKIISSLLTEGYMHRLSTCIDYPNAYLDWQVGSTVQAQQAGWTHWRPYTSRTHYHYWWGWKWSRCSFLHHQYHCGCLLQFPLQAGTYCWGWSAGIGHFSAIQYLEVEQHPLCMWM